MGCRTDNTKPFLLIELKNNKMGRYKIKDKQQVIDWFNNFADHIEGIDKNLYQEAIDYADDQECEF
jgi:hypothetical protein